ncbi:APC family permease [Curtobacterium citreum]|nr:APC family permease [Curtobacterium albidum]
MGTAQLALTVLAFSSPLTSMAGYFSLTILSNGTTAPVSFLIITLVLLVFSVGYMAMTKRMPKPGAFYAYITEGLGRRIGLGSAFLATASYSLMCVGIYCFVGMTASGLVAKFVGVTIPWWLGTAVAWALIGVLGYCNVEVSARVLTWVMAVEVGIVVIFDVVIAVRGGAGGAGISVSSFDFGTFFHGQVWVGLLFAMLVFIGFEATALYRDEVKRPEVTIPRATYFSVVFIGVLYTASVWMLVAAFGASAQNTATDHTAGMFAIATDRYIGTWFSDIVTVLLVTAVLASVLSTHNISSRYLFAISADGSLPSQLGQVHPKFRSPHRASLAISGLMLAVLIVVVTLRSDPSTVYAQLAGLGGAGVLLLMVLVSVAVVVWFARQRRQHTATIWSSVIAPAVAAIVLTALTVFAISNFDLVAGTKGAVWVLLGIVVVTFAAGFLIPSWRRRAADTSNDAQL